MLGGLGGNHLIIIIIIAFLLFGPDKIPQIARTIGKFMREFKKIQDEMETTMRAEMYKVDLTPNPGVTSSAGSSPSLAAEPSAASGGSGSAVSVEKKKRAPRVKPLAESYQGSEVEEEDEE